MDRNELRSLNNILHSGQLLAGREIIVRRRPDVSVGVPSVEKKSINTLERLKIQRDSGSSGAPHFVRNLKAPHSYFFTLISSLTRSHPVLNSSVPVLKSASESNVPFDQSSMISPSSNDSSPRLSEKRPSGHLTFVSPFLPF